MKNKQIISALVGIAIIGALAGLILEVVIEGDAAKFRRLIQNIEGNANFLSFPLGSAYMESVQNMISHATISFELTAIPTDPDPNVNGDEYYLNQISECVFHSSEDIPFPTCLICQLTEERPEKLNCDCEKPTIFTVQYNNPSFPADEVRIEVYKKEGDFGKPDKLLAKFYPVLDGALITIDSRDFLTGSKNTVESNTAYRVIRAGNEVASISIHTSCSQPLFIGDVHEGSNNVDDVAFTVISGTDVNFNPTIPEATCRTEEDVKCKGLTSMTVAYSGPARWIEVNDKKITDVIIEDTTDPLLSDPPEITVIADSNKLPANTKFKIYEIETNGERGSFIDEIEIHTSCSKPINIGDMHTTAKVQGVLTIIDLDKIFE